MLPKPKQEVLLKIYICPSNQMVFLYDN